MSRKYHITLEIEMPEDTTDLDARAWAGNLLDIAFTKDNPTPRPSGSAGWGWKSVIPMSPSEHPYRPKVVGAKEVAQPTPRRREFPGSDPDDQIP